MVCAGVCALLRVHFWVFALSSEDWLATNPSRMPPSLLPRLATDEGDSSDQSCPQWPLGGGGAPAAIWCKHQRTRSGENPTLYTHAFSSSRESLSYATAAIYIVALITGRSHSALGNLPLGRPQIDDSGCKSHAISSLHLPCCARGLTPTLTVVVGKGC